MDRSGKGLSEIDLEIIKRLERLKEDRKVPEVSEDELKQRLAKLRDLPESSATKSNIPVVKYKSDQEQCDDLIKQYMIECQIENSINEVCETIEQKMNHLRIDIENKGVKIDKPVMRVIQEAMLVPSDDEFSDDDLDLSPDDTMSEKTSSDEDET